MSRFNKMILPASAQLPMLSVVSASAIVLITLEILFYGKNELWGRICATLFSLCSTAAFSLAVLKEDRYSRLKSDWHEGSPAFQKHIHQVGAWLMANRHVIIRHAVVSVCFVFLFLFLNYPEVIVLSHLGSVAWYPATGVALALLLGVGPWYGLL